MLLTPAIAKAAGFPDTVAEEGAAVILQVHAEGAQIYECKIDASNKFAWQFREPIATLIQDGKTVGRHYAGPTWEVAGSAVVGKLASAEPGRTADDIPWLKLNVVDRRGEDSLKEATTIQRVNTVGGMLQGGCDEVGALRSVPYSADYLFLKH